MSCRPVRCLEFDEALATIDVLYDLTFLLMDRGADQRGSRTSFNRYLDECDEADGSTLVPSYGDPCPGPRTRYSGSGRRCTAGSQELLRTEARAYFEVAIDLLKTTDPMLVAFAASAEPAIHGGLFVAPYIGAPAGLAILT